MLVDSIPFHSFLPAEYLHCRCRQLLSTLPVCRRQTADIDPKGVVLGCVGPKLQKGLKRKTPGDILKAYLGADVLDDTKEIKIHAKSYQQESRRG